MKSESRTFASIDLGSHTIRMLIARVDPKGRIVPVAGMRRITRLARNFTEGETLKPESMDLSMSVLHEYAKILQEHGVCHAVCGATGVVRRAKNGQEFLDAVFDATAIRGRILSEWEESLISAKGVFSVLPHYLRLVLSFDLGGSSTELLLMDREESDPIFSRSVFIGAATLTEAHLHGDPPVASDVQKARETIRRQVLPAIGEALEQLKQSGRAFLPLYLVGTAGTATTLAAMSLKMIEYNPSRINGTEVQTEWLEQMVNRLAASTHQDRRAIAGLEPGREDIILGGALIVQEMLAALGKDRMIVTDAGLLEGLLLELVEEKLGLPGGPSP